MIKLYDERDICEQDHAGGFYCQHVMAMTAEGLHDKTDIAAELGHRDMIIADLKEELRNYEKCHNLVMNERDAALKMLRERKNNAKF